jgi:hypothetical protein
VYVDLEFWVRHLTCIADVRRYSMLAEKAASILSWMVVWIEDLPHCCILEGAKMSMLRWRRSHQKGGDDAGDDEEV